MSVQSVATPKRYGGVVTSDYSDRHPREARMMRAAKRRIDRFNRATGRDVLAETEALFLERKKPRRERRGF